MSPPIKLLPPPIREAIAWVHRELKEGQQLKLIHITAVLDAVGRVASYEDAELARTVMQLMMPFNDVLRGILPEIFKPAKPGETLSTSRVNFIIDAVRLVDQAMDEAGDHRKERDAIRLVLPVVRKRLADAQVATIQSYRGELQRKTSRSALPKGAIDRYRKQLPAEAGDTPQKRFAWLMARLERAAKDSP
jgi:hypothetical protein